MKLRDRIKELRRVPAADLRPNAKNWREHPAEQKDALRGVLAEVGIADALIARELEDGSLELIDGHLRTDTDPAAIWPVLVLDVTADEADKLLATFDPLAAMAKTNATQLDALLRDVETSSEGVAAMLAELAKEAGLYQTESDSDESTDATTSDSIPHTFQVAVECKDEKEQRDLYDRMKSEGRKCRVLTV